MIARLALLAALTLPSLAAAQTGPIAASDINSVLGAIRSYGHKAKLETDENNQQFISVEREGVQYFVYFYTCDNPPGCLDMEFYTGFDVDTALTADWANEWNRNRIMGRVNVDEAGDPGVSYFLTTTGGLTVENFNGIMEVWDITLDSLMEEINWQ